MNTKTQDSRVPNHAQARSILMKSLGGKVAPVKTKSREVAYARLTGVDGEDHINVSTNGTTPLGVMLSFDFDKEWVHDRAGVFRTMEGFNSYLRIEGDELIFSQMSYEQSRNSYRNFKSRKFVEHYRALLLDGVYQRIMQNPQIVDMMIESHQDKIPFMMYYHIRQNPGYVVSDQNSEWFTKGLNVIRHALAHGKKPNLIPFLHNFHEHQVDFNNQVDFLDPYDFVRSIIDTRFSGLLDDADRQRQLQDRLHRLENRFKKGEGKKTKKSQEFKPLTNEQVDVGSLDQQSEKNLGVKVEIMPGTNPNPAAIELVLQTKSEVQAPELEVADLTKQVTDYIEDETNVSFDGPNEHNMHLAVELGIPHDEPNLPSTSVLTSAIGVEAYVVLGTGDVGGGHVSNVGTSSDSGSVSGD